MPSIVEIQHPSHPEHQLKLMRPQTPYCCDGCKNEGYEPCYQCRECGFYLYEECSSGSRTRHPFFKNIEFVFSDHKSIGGVHAGFCDACGKSVKGSRYHSLHPPNVFLHPCCLKLQTDTTDAEKGVSLKLIKKISWSSKCLKCHSRKLSPEVPGWAYESTCGHFHYHVACVKDLFLEKWKKAYLDQQNDGETTSIVSLVVEHGVLTAGTGRKARRLSSSKIKLVLQLIIAAIFGDGISIIIPLVSAAIAA